MISTLRDKRKLKAAERIRRQTNCWPWEIMEERYNPPPWSFQLLEALSALAVLRSPVVDDSIDIIQLRDSLTSHMLNRRSRHKERPKRSAVHLQAVDVVHAKEAFSLAYPPSELLARREKAIAPAIAPRSPESAELLPETRDWRHKPDIPLRFPQSTDVIHDPDNTDSSVWPEDSTTDRGPQRQKAINPKTARSLDIPTTPKNSSNSDLQSSRSGGVGNHPFSSNNNRPPSTRSRRVFRPSPILLSDDGCGSDTQDEDPRPLTGTLRKRGRPAAPQQDHHQLASKDTTSSRVEDGRRPAKRQRSLAEVGAPEDDSSGIQVLQKIAAVGPDTRIQQLEAPILEVLAELQSVTASVAIEVRSLRASEAAALKSANEQVIDETRQLDDLEATAGSLDSRVRSAEAQLLSAKKVSLKAQETVTSLRALLSSDDEHEEAILKTREEAAAVAARNEATAASRVRELTYLRDRFQQSTISSLQTSRENAVQASIRHRENLGRLRCESRALKLYSGLVSLGPAGLLHMLSLENLGDSLEAGLQKYCQDFSSETRAGVGDKGGDCVADSVQAVATS
ncbi:hypothetical protein INS49_003958 [Diaporthe citri]|uniref:uncharacterized protein n=1 Tax=Diaporthe citri TaxID=83186 RepID=UPI001C80CB3A|nr:uncharacterized protein INS49_003958 [Diaporthe citri]KAG6354877.1 hypothetical protein INS49_003958 [Diaporthe citri]